MHIKKNSVSLPVKMLKTAFMRLSCLKSRPITTGHFVWAQACACMSQYRGHSAADDGQKMLLMN